MSDAGSSKKKKKNKNRNKKKAKNNNGNEGNSNGPRSNLMRGIKTGLTIFKETMKQNNSNRNKTAYILTVHTHNADNLHQ